MVLKTKLHFAEQIIDHAFTNPHLNAVNHIDSEGRVISITYKDLLKKILSHAAYLRLHAKEGDRIMICLPTGVDYIAMFFACMFAGVIAVPCMPPVNLESAKRMNLILNNSESKFVIANKEILTAYKKLNLIHTLDNSFTKPIHMLLTNLHKDIKIDSDLENWIAIEDIPTFDGEITFVHRWDDPVFLQYTSGSTRSPRGVKVSVKNLLSNFDTISYNTNWNSEPVNSLSWMPLYHDMGLIGMVLYPLYNGGQTTIMSPLDFLKSPHKWAEYLSKFRANSTGGPNFAYELVQKNVSDEMAAGLDLSNLKWIYSGAEPINHEILEKFLKKFKLSETIIYPVYGLAEATLMVSGKKREAKLKTLKVSKEAFDSGKIVLADEAETNFVEMTSCGGVDPDVHIEIVDLTTNELLPEASVGEICLKSDSISSGYWNNDEETEKNFTLRRNGERISIFRTGDLGFLYDGELYCTGRKRDIVYLKGRTFYPQDIEHFIEKSNQNIRQGCIAAFSVTEELVVVAEVKETPTKEDVDRMCAEIKRHFQITPKEIKLIAPRTILKTTSGKIRRRDIKQYYLDNKLNVLI